MGLLVVLFALAAGYQDSLPEAPGKALFEKTCGDCHETSQVVARRRPRAVWEQTVEDMVGRGAQGSREDFAAIVDYLASQFGRTDVNSATADEIRKSVGLSAKDAQAIVQYREKNGKIADFDQLLAVPGIDVAKVKEKKAAIAFAP